jgi:hypothetical protein
MKKLSLPLFIASCLVLSSGCSMTPLGGYEAGKGPHGAKIDRMEAVTSGGGQKAVLSLHKKYAYVDSCKFGLSLTNNLPYKITNISFRFAAYIKGDVFYRHVTRNFFEIDPTNRQYREITFSQITCDQISYIEITDPGRCAVGDLTRFSSGPGDCIRNVYIAPTPYVRLVQK